MADDLSCSFTITPETSVGLNPLFKISYLGINLIGKDDRIILKGDSGNYNDVDLSTELFINEENHIIISKVDFEDEIIPERYRTHDTRVADSNVRTYQYIPEKT